MGHKNQSERSFDHLCSFDLLLGDYAGFDENQPTSSSGGKAIVARIIKKERGVKTLVMIGDGATDMEAVPPAVSSSNEDTENCQSPLRNHV